MKSLTLSVLAVALFLAVSPAAYSQMIDLRHDGEHPGMERFGMGFDHHGMIDPNVSPIIHELRLETTLETFHVNIEKARLDAAEKKISLNEKRRELMENLKSLFKKYQSDKTVGKDIVQGLKDLNGVRKDIRQIDRDAMAKMKALKDGLDSDIDKAVDTYLSKLQGNPDELAKISKFFNRERHEEIKDKD